MQRGGTRALVEPAKRKRAQLSSKGINTGRMEVKKRCEGLQQKLQRRMPSRFNDFVVHATMRDIDVGIKQYANEMSRSRKNIKVIIIGYASK